MDQGRKARPPAGNRHLNLRSNNLDKIKLRMNPSINPSAPIPAEPNRTWTPNARTRLVFRLLESLRIGELRMHLPDGSQRIFCGDTQPPGQQLMGEIMVHDDQAFSFAFSRGDIGFGEAYMQGMWSSPDPAALLKLLLVNREAITEVIYGRWWAIVFDQLRHLLRFNRKAQARKNIAAHYDLGNDFYRLWLDPSMCYSSALFDGTGLWHQPVDLQEGQRRKIRRAINEVAPQRLNSNSAVLEIGCGWGAIAREVLDNTQARYVGLTLSEEQKRWADSILGDIAPSRYDIRLQDYRDERGRYDAIISIEMFEAVGEQYWDTYFAMLARCLKSDGLAVIQTITIEERLFERYRRGTDFIQQYIFPGGMLPSSTEFEHRAKKQGLRVEKSLSFGQDYARTLAEWAKEFDRQRTRITALGFDERFIRMWKFYLAYCEAGFSEGDINVVQYTLRHGS